MWAFIASQLRARRGRALALALAILVAATGFILLASTARTSQVRVRGTVESTYRAAYDILVRPRGSQDPLERQAGLVRPNFLSGIFGGISFGQWHTIQHIPGVAVAAPVANVGFILPSAAALVPLNREVTDAPFQLYRIKARWIADRGLSRYPAQEQYVYYTPRDRFVLASGSGRWMETGPAVRAPLASCGRFPVTPSRSPFPPLASMAFLSCFPTARSRYGSTASTVNSFIGPSPAWVGGRMDVHFPIFIAAVDPREEAKLVGLDRTLVRGRYLSAAEGLSPYTASGLSFRAIPILASSRSYLNEDLELTIERLRIRPGTNVPGMLAGADPQGFVQHLPGYVVARRSLAIGAIYRGSLTAPPPNVSGWKPGTFGINAYWTTSPTRYRPHGTERLAPVPTSNRASVWRSQFNGGFYLPPRDNQDLQFRRLHERVSSNTFTGRTADYPLLEVVGQFDPERLPSFSPLSKVPLETYFPPELLPADAAARQALGGQPLLASQNLGGYIQPPPLFLTTMQALTGFLDPRVWSRGLYSQQELANGVNVSAVPSLQRKAPISAIRVRVAGVTGPDPLSLERVRVVARKVHDKTGLAVDITAGSSPHAVDVLLPAGKFGRPPLLLSEGWSKKGASISFLKALDRKDLSLFSLILVLGGFFLANGAVASVRTRRAEIGTLLTLGWDRKAIFSVILGELALLGLVAGVLGSGVAAVLIAVFSLRAAPLAVLLVPPVAVGLAVAAGLTPAWLASRTAPLDALRAPVARHTRRLPVRRLAGLALVNVRRVPGRALVSVGGLVIGVASLTVLIGIQRAFQGTLVGTLLGNAISLQVSRLDFAAIGFTIAFAVLSTADVLYLNLRERAPELVTLRTLGWSDRHFATVVAFEALLLGLAGSLSGAVVGLAVGAGVLGIPAGSLAVAALLAAAGGVAATVLACLLPLSQINQLVVPSVLAEE